MDTLTLENEEFAVVTLHRPSNVDDPDVLEILLNEIFSVSRSLDIVWPLHPRTRSRIENLGRMSELESNQSILMKPLGYTDFMQAIMGSRCVITDSGGIQEETTWLGVPCITLRPNTERPITITEGYKYTFNSESLKRIRESICSTFEKRIRK